jgi:3-methylcrotonyl-CoA carboxylase alpha subunit
LRQALADYEVAGVATNLAFLARIAAHPAYAAGEVDTGFIARHAADLFPTVAPASREVLAAAVLRVLDDERREVEARAAASADPWSPWNQLTLWRMNSPGYRDLLFRDGESKISVRVHAPRHGSLRAVLAGAEAELRGTEDALWIDGVKTRATAVRRGDRITVILDGTNHELHLLDPLGSAGAEEEAAGSLTAPMPGRIIQVLAEPGATVSRGAGLMILEAMKMEYTITAPADGKIEQIRYAPGDVVDEGAELIVFAPATEPKG